MLRYHRHRPGADCSSYLGADAGRPESADAVAWRWHEAEAAAMVLDADDPDAPPVIQKPFSLAALAAAVEERLADAHSAVA